MKTLIAKSIINAIRTRAMEQAANYIVIATDRKYLDRWYTITHRANPARSYEVDLFAKTCTCEAFNRDSYCKHCVLAQRERADLNRYEAEEAKLSDPDYINYIA